jgi:hypothetical protein
MALFGGRGNLEMCNARYDIWDKKPRLVGGKGGGGGRGEK